MGSQTRHVDVRQCFLRELKESKIIDIRWVKGTDYDTDVFTKNLDGPAFKKCIKTLRVRRVSGGIRWFSEGYLDFNYEIGLQSKP